MSRQNPKSCQDTQEFKICLRSWQDIQMSNAGSKENGGMKRGAQKRKENQISCAFF